MGEVRFIRLALVCNVSLAIATAQQPIINNNGVVNAASYVPLAAPGSLLVVFGSNLASKTIVASSTPLTTHLQTDTDDIAVQIGGQWAPIYYVSPTQLSVQVPWVFATSGSVIMAMTRNGKESAPVWVPVAQVSPGIFTVSQNGQGMGWAINAITGKVAQPAGSIPGVANVGPAAVGDHLFLYATGLGQVAPPVDDGAAPCPLSGCPPGAWQSTTLGAPAVRVGGVQAKVEFSGLSPQFVGVYQVNFQVPAEAPTGNSVPLQLQMAGYTSNTVTLAIQ